jgi:hypothetical protein
MEKIVIMNSEANLDGAVPAYLVPLVACVRMLFPECEIEVVSPREETRIVLEFRNEEDDYRWRKT